MSAPGRMPVGPGAVRLLPVLLLAPCVIWLILFFLAPFALMAWRSLVEAGRPTLANYAEILGEPLYRSVLWTTLRFALLTTLACLVLGYPVALLLTRVRGWTWGLLLVAVAVPYWLDYVVRSYAWLVLLGRRGLLNQALVALGLAADPRSHLGTDAAVLVGMVQIMLPLMVLTIYAGLLRIDAELLNAAAAHGAGDWQVFREVVWPLSLPGVVAGALLVFVNAVGFYVTPALLGGPRQTMISQSIDVLASRLLDWPLASAAAVLLLAVTTLIVLAFNRWFGLDRLWGGRAA